MSNAHIHGKHVAGARSKPELTDEHVCVCVHEDERTNERTSFEAALADNY